MRMNHMEIALLRKGKNHFCCFLFWGLETSFRTHHRTATVEAFFSSDLSRLGGHAFMKLLDERGENLGRTSQHSLSDVPSRL
jgi:hypothetical protein